MPRPNSSPARQWGNVTMPHPGNALALHRVNLPRARSTPVPHRAHNIPALPRGPSQEPRNKKSVRIATFLRLAIAASSSIANRGAKTQQKWHISSLKEPRRAPNRKKLQRYRVFCFLQWVRSLQQGKSRENARSIMASNPKSETRKAPAMRTPQEKPIRLKSTLPWHHTARNKHRVQPSTYRRSPLRPELRGCTGAR